MQAPTTTQYHAVHPFLLVYIYLACATVLIGIALMLFGRVATGMLAVASAGLFWHSLRKSTRRRYLVDTRYFRPCRYPLWSLRLLWNRTNLEFLRLACVALLVAASWYDYTATYAVFLSVGLLAPTSTLLLFAAIVMLAKFRIDTHFRIVVFRKNRSPFNHAHKAEVMPACGLFGQVLLIDDLSLDKTWEGGRLRLSQWVLSEMYQPLDAGESSDGWRDVALTELSFADFVVFDWSGEITENMAWEMARAREFVPAHRWLLIAPSETASAALTSLPQEMHALVLAVEPLTSPAAVRDFRVALASRLVHLEFEARGSSG